MTKKNKEYYTIIGLICIISILLLVMFFTVMIFGINKIIGEECLQKIAENVCKGKGSEFDSLLYQSLILDKEKDFFICINTDGRKLKYEDFLFSKKEVESCK